MSNRENEVRAWIIDQLEKSQYFHQKLHEWRLLEMAYELERIHGENFDWDLKRLNISQTAWNKVIHRGIKPVKVFCHPEVILEDPRRVMYYRMLAMVSQKSMGRIGLSVSGYEDGTRPMNRSTALRVSRHLNKIISVLVEHDDIVDEREFDLWRGMAAGSQAQGSWQNIKGDRAEVLVKDLVANRIRESKLLAKEVSHGRSRKSRELILKDGRIVRMGSDPDIGVYRGRKPLVAVEIKGGIDPAGVLERLGAALKSFGRVKRKNPSSVTVLLIYEVSLTEKVKEELKNNSNVIDHVITMEDLINDKSTKDKLFKILKI